MAYDEDLANRVRGLVLSEHGVAEQRMFGGLAFLIDGNMSVAVSGQGGLMLRVEPAETEALQATRAAVRDARPCDAGLAAGRGRGSGQQAPARAMGRARSGVRAVAAEQTVAATATA
jgi:hypothetical protein